MKRGLAIPYIIALILGIIILAVAAYLIYKAVTRDQINCQECRARFTTWCSVCYLGDWEHENQLGDELAKCVDKCGYWTGAIASKNCNLDKDEATEACASIGVP